MPDVRLEGCCSRPLLGYLKALGVLRIVASQADAEARGRWRRGCFELRSTLDGDALADLLLDRYSPSPVVSPWNGGSGFHPNDRKDAILTLERSDDPRFAPYAAAISRARTVLRRRRIDTKPTADQKLPLIRELRRSLPDEALDWLDAAIVVTGNEVGYPPLLGSGGNDGRFDFSNNYAQAVVTCLRSDTRAESAAALRGALTGESALLQRKLSLAHLSRDSSPTNSPFGEADSLGNPWDLVLSVEGTMLLAAGAARRHGRATAGSLVAPFTVRATAAGYGSAVDGEAGRAELWLPIWERWATRAEIVQVARESRAQVGTGRARRQASTGLDFARAAGQLGVAQGIDRFERYAILERAGQSNLAVPIGGVDVAPRPVANALASVEAWIASVEAVASSDHAPRSLRSIARWLKQSTFQLAAHGGKRDACAVLELLGAAELALSRSASTTEATGIRPLRGVPAAAWRDAADDGSPEFAVAFALGSLRDHTRRSPMVRDYLNGTLDGGHSFDPARRHSIVAAQPAILLARIHARRHLDARSGAADTRRGLDFDSGSYCQLELARLFAAGLLDDARILRLLRGLALLDHRNVSALPSRPYAETAPQVAFDVLALAWGGQRTRRSGSRPLTVTSHTADAAKSNDDWGELGARPGWAARLASEASPSPLEALLRDALLRLRIARLPPALLPKDVTASRPDGPQLGAALLLRLTPRDLRRLAERLTLHTPENTRESEATKEVAPT